MFFHIVLATGFTFNYFFNLFNLSSVSQYMYNCVFK